MLHTCMRHMRNCISLHWWPRGALAELRIVDERRRVTESMSASHGRSCGRCVENPIVLKRNNPLALKS